MDFKNRKNEGPAVTYTLVPKVLPGKEDGQRLYYAQSRARGELGLEEMAERISQNCTLTRSDIIGVLAALEDEVCQGLCNGEIVRLGGIGSLQAGICSEGVERPGDFTAGRIRRLRVLFRPAGLLKKSLAHTRFERVAVNGKEEL